MSRLLDAVIIESGNGFPRVDEYVTDGNDVYRIARYIGSIQTEQFSPNYCHAEVERADWEDVGDDASLCSCRIADAGGGNPTEWAFTDANGDLITDGWRGYERDAVAHARKLANRHRDAVSYWPSAEPNAPERVVFPDRAAINAELDAADAHAELVEERSGLSANEAREIDSERGR